jgi:hypothetical protein
MGRTGTPPHKSRATPATRDRRDATRSSPARQELSPSRPHRPQDSRRVPASRATPEACPLPARLPRRARFPRDSRGVPASRATPEACPLPARLPTHAPHPAATPEACPTARGASGGSAPGADMTSGPGPRFPRAEATQTLVELRGFEPLTPSMRTRCATSLRHSPADGHCPPNGERLTGQRIEPRAGPVTQAVWCRPPASYARPRKPPTRR